MKKTIILIALICVATSASAEVLSLYTFGNASYYFDNTFEASLAVGVETPGYSGISVFAEAEPYTGMVTSQDVFLLPVQQRYYVRTGVWFGAFNITYEHMTQHAIDSVKPAMNKAQDKISIGFDSRRKK